MKEKVPEVFGLLICHSSDKSEEWKLRNLFSHAIFYIFVLLQSSRAANQGRNDKEYNKLHTHHILCLNCYKLLKSLIFLLILYFTLRNTT